MEDDFGLLDEMMHALDGADPLYRPTNYWAFYERRFLPELRRKGLTKFRRRRDSVLSSFGATDLLSRPQLRVKSNSRIGRAGSRLATRLIASTPFLELGDTARLKETTAYFFWHTKEKFDRAGLPLDRCSMSPAGDPEDVLEMEGGLWSLAHLQNCAIFADAAHYITIPPDGVLAELGAGLGRNIEIAAKLMPHATLLVFDIPPQLYVSHQYLKAVFGDRVVGYREGLAIDWLRTDARDRIRGRIVIQPSWRLPAWSAVRLDVFWNSASFQEMEPSVVVNYLKLVSTMTPRWVYINALPGGNYWGPGKKGSGGTREPVHERYYRETLAPLYRLDVSYPTDYFLRNRDYQSYVFVRT